MEPFSLPQYREMHTKLEALHEREESRQRECLARVHGQCLLVSRGCGWVVATDIDECDRCVELGGLRNSRRSRAWRRALVRTRVADAIASFPSIGRAQVMALILLHGKGRLLRRLMADPGAVAAVDREENWKRVKISWSAAASFLRSATSALVEGAVAEEVFRVREGSCFGEKGLDGSYLPGREPCPALRWSDGRSYCGDCGCGTSTSASLSPETPGGFTKLHFPYLKCPRRRLGFSNAVDSRHVQPPHGVQGDGPPHR